MRRVPGEVYQDPTKNVLALVEAANRRQDDLRTAEVRHLADEVRHLTAMAELRAEHNRELAAKETARLDAIRAVDASAVARASEVAAAAALALASQVAASAEAQRTTIASTVQPILTRLEELSRAQSQLQGQKVAQTETKGNSQWALGFALSSFVALVALAGLILVLATTHP